MRRNSSIGARAPARSKCQNVQPLQASRPWTRAPTRWIEPVWVSGPQCSVGANLGGVARSEIGEDRPGIDQAGLDQRAEGNRGSDRFPRAVSSPAGGAGSIRREARLGGGDVIGLALDPDEAAAEAFGDRAGGAGAEKRIEDDVARPRGRA